MVLFTLAATCCGCGCLLVWCFPGLLCLMVFCLDCKFC